MRGLPPTLPDAGPLAATLNTMTRRNHKNLATFIQTPQMCGEKRRYASQAEAQKVAEEQQLLHPGLKLAIYKCISCGGWHLTRHQPGVV